MKIGRVLQHVRCFLQNTCKGWCFKHHILEDPGCLTSGAMEVVPSESYPTLASAVERAKDGSLIQIQFGMPSSGG